MKIEKQRLAAYKKTEKSRKKPSAKPASPKKEAPSSLGFLKEVKSDKGAQKAALLLVALGGHEAKKILNYLLPEERKKISDKIAGIGKLDHSQKVAVLKRAGLYREAREVPEKTGREVAHELLLNFYGEEKGSRLYKKITPDRTPHPFAFLQEFQLHQLMPVFHKEPPHVIAMILPYLPPDFAAKIVKNLPQKVQLETITRMAKVDKVSEAAIEQVENYFKNRIERESEDAAESIAVDGKGALTEILKQMQPTDEAKILADLEQRLPDLSRDLQKSLTNLDLLKTINSRSLSEFLREREDLELAFVYLRSDEEGKEVLNSALPQGRRLDIETEAESMREAPFHEQERSITLFLTDLKKALLAGRFIINGDDEWV